MLPQRPYNRDFGWINRDVLWCVEQRRRVGLTEEEIAEIFNWRFKIRNYKMMRIAERKDFDNIALSHTGFMHGDDGFVLFNDSSDFSNSGMDY